MFGSNIEGIELNHFMIILLLDPYFKIKSWIYRGILRVLVKKSLNLISFLSILEEWKFEVLKMSIPSYSFHSLPLKLPNKRMSFSFSLLKLSNKEIKEYFKIILFILFYSLLPNEALVTTLQGCLKNHD